jgi:uncharacterized membrane protein YebE (DUF533 family)
MSTTGERLRAVLRVACEDALFATLGTGPKLLDFLARKRGPAHEAFARGDRNSFPSLAFGGWDPWMRALCRITAGSAAPWYLPMREAVDDGLTLEQEPTGLRALINIGHASHVERVRREGTMTVRILRAVASSDGQLGDDERQAIELLLAAMGLPEADTRVLLAEPAMPIASIEVPGGLDPKLARAIVTGAWEAAMADGLEEAERAAILAVGARLGVDPQTVEQLGQAAAKTVEAQLVVGAATVDAIRYVLAPLADEVTRPLVRACLVLATPPRARAEALRALDRASTPLKQPHALDKASRAAVLAASWAAVLAFDPPITLRARTLARHERVANDMGAERLGREAREVVEEYVAGVLSRAVLVSGG